MSEKFENGENEEMSSSGEYHYTQPENGKLYTDANYVRQDETTAPPRYYVPPEKKAPAPKKEKKPNTWIKVACMCLVCALLGGVAGGALAGQAVSKQLKETTSQSASIPVTSSAPQTISASTSGALSAQQIYAQACEQVVGIQSDITYMNFFGQTASAATSGSGFFISKDGHILTNYHVVKDAINSNSVITVLTHDGTSYKAKVIGTEESNDLAVLKIDATGTNAATFADSSKMTVGDTVYAVGNPMGELQFTMTSGMISALDRAVTTSVSDTSMNMFQFDAAINSGNSGGPVYNAYGQVIGIATAKYSSSSSSASVEGLGFAIPSSDAQRIANDLMTVGHVTGKAYLGVSIDQNYTSVYSKYYNLPEGAYVKYVTTGYVAEKAGVAAGDIITKLGDKDIKSYSDLANALKQFRAGDKTTITVYRSGEYLELDITLDEQPAETASSAPSDSSDNQLNQYGNYFGNFQNGNGNTYFG